MEHLKNIAAGLLGLNLVAFAIAGLLAFGALTLEGMDWILRNRPSMLFPLMYAAGGVALIFLAWALGRSMRVKPQGGK